MKGIKATRLPITTRVMRTAPLSLPLTLRTQIEQIWSDAIANHPNLFNGKIYTLKNYKDGNLYIAESEYKVSFSIQKSPNIFKENPISILAVTGILLCEDGLILGRRGNSVSFQNGLWEPAPAGSLSCPDPKAQVLEELEEELGIARNRINEIEITGLIEDNNTSIADIIYKITIREKFNQIKSIEKNSKDNEHDELYCVKIADLGSFLAENQGKYIPILPDVLRLAGLI